MRLWVLSYRMLRLWLRPHHLHADTSGGILASKVVTSCHRSEPWRRRGLTHPTIDLPMNLFCFIIMNLCCDVWLWNCVVYSLWTCDAHLWTYVVKLWICELVLWICELLFIMCYCDATAGNLYWIVGSSIGRLGPECTKHYGHCTSPATLSDVTCVVLGVTT
jgi:hypothetical protein